MKMSSPSSTQAKTIYIAFTKDDFDCLSETSMNWAGEGWEKQAERFEIVDRVDSTKTKVHQLYDFKRIYWFEADSAYAIARAFLRGAHEGFVVAYDHNLNQIVILTDFGGAL